MIFNLLLANITILLCFFLYLVLFNSFLTIPVEIENAILKLALTIPTGAPITYANDAMEMLPVVTDQTMTYQNSQRKQYIYLVFCSLILFL